MPRIHSFQTSGRSSMRFGLTALLFCTTVFQTVASSSSWKSEVEADWARQDAKRWRAIGTNVPSIPERIRLVLERGLKLADKLTAMGASAEKVAAFRQLAGTANLQSDQLPPAQEQDRYLKVRWAVREMALSNPLLNFDSILFVKRAPGMFPHMSDQYYGWWSRPGGGIYALQNFKAVPSLRTITEQLPNGSFMGPDVSFDGKKLLFAYCEHHEWLRDEKNKADKARVPESAFYHVFEIGADGTNLRQLTRGKYDDFDPRYLPGGDIVFVSTRKGTAIQCSQWFSDSTRESDRADSYVRCGGDNYRPVPVFTLHGLDPVKGTIRPLSAFENFEWTPSVANDGRILYTRWDYIDRFNGHFFSLWSANQDGTNPQLVYGNYTVKPQVKFQARAIPGSDKLLFNAAAHHSNAGGTLCLLDRDRGTEADAPIRRLTPDVRFPETEANDAHYYDAPWPLSEDFYLVGWADAPLPPHGRFEDDRNPVNAMGIYLLDSYGNMELLHRDPKLSSCTPMPLAARKMPPVQATLAHGNGGEATVMIQSVYKGLTGVAHGSVSRLRVIGVPPKVQPHMNSPMLGVSAEDPGKFVLGTVPVERDGSAYFKVPAGVPVFFQALDRSGVAVQTMRTLTYAMPGQTLSCVGCHESRESAPPVAEMAIATRRQPSNITPGPEGSWPLRFDQLVQPVLDKNCRTCHSPGTKEFDKSKLDLAGASAWQNLMAFGGEELKKQAFERDRSFVNEGVAANSRLWRMLTASEKHHDVKLDPESLDRIATWLDTYAHKLGHFSDAQERDLMELKRLLQPLMEVSKAASP